MTTWAEEVKNESVSKIDENSTSVLGSLWTTHPTREGFQGDETQALQHLGMTIDNVRMVFRVTARKVKRVKRIALSIVINARRNRRQVDRLLTIFCRYTQELIASGPEERFRVQALHSAVASWNVRRATLPSAAVLEVL